MAKELIIIGIKGCPGCEKVKKAIEKGELNARYLDVEDDPEAQEIVDELQPVYAPFAVVKEGNKYKECKITQKNGKFEIDCEKSGEIEIE